jgi:lipid A 3-O-deacylase
VAPKRGPIIEPQQLSGRVNVKRFLLVGCTGLAAIALPGAASAGEIFGGLYAHNVDTPLSLDGHTEDGADVQLGWRGGGIARLFGTSLQPYVFGALNTAGDTSYAAVGLSAKFGGRVYVRPGLGLAVHTGSAAHFENPFNDKLEFGSRVLFEPELGLGYQFTPRISAEASWVHMSHATLFSGQNPGIDNIGVRVNVALP